MLRTAIVPLRLIATLFVLAPLMAFLVTVAGMAYSVNAGGEVKQEAIATRLSISFTTVLYSLLLYPVGVLLHWMIARQTRLLSSGARQALFWGSLWMCTSFPLGTIMGGVTLWLFIFSPAFQSRRIMSP